MNDYKLSHAEAIALHSYEKRAASWCTVVEEYPHRSLTVGTD